MSRQIAHFGSFKALFAPYAHVKDMISVPYHRVFREQARDLLHNLKQDDVALLMLAGDIRKLYPYRRPDKIYLVTKQGYLFVTQWGKISHCFSSSRFGYSDIFLNSSKIENVGFEIALLWQVLDKLHGEEYTTGTRIVDFYAS